MIFVPNRKRYKRIELIVYGIIAIAITLTLPYLFSIGEIKRKPTTIK